MTRLNAAEDAFEQWAIGEGWEPTKRGWPDFLCYRAGSVMAVEVKYSDDLSVQQRAACQVLVSHGIPVFVWTPGGDLTPYGELVGGIGGDAYQLAIEIARLREDNGRLRDELVRAQLDAGVANGNAAQVRKDLRYVLRLTVYLKDRPERLRGLLRLHPEVGDVRPALRSNGGRGHRRDDTLLGKLHGGAGESE